MLCSHGDTDADRTVVAFDFWKKETVHEFDTFGLVVGICTSLRYQRIVESQASVHVVVARSKAPVAVPMQRVRMEVAETVYHSLRGRVQKHVEGCTFLWRESRLLDNMFRIDVVDINVLCACTDGSPRLETRDQRERERERTESDREP